MAGAPNNAAVWVALLTLVAGQPRQAAGQETVQDVQRFRWGPVLIHVSANSVHGVELFALAGDDYLLTWFPPERIADWTRSVDSLLALSLGPPASETARYSTPPLKGRFTSELQVVRELSPSDSVYGLRLAGPPMQAPLFIVIRRTQVQEITEALARAAPVATALKEGSGDRAQPVFESWQVDEEPSPFETKALFTRVPPPVLQRLKGGRVLTTFIVDTLGRVEVGSIEIHEASEPGLGRIYSELILPDWNFSAGLKGNRKVATRLTRSITLEVTGAITIGH